MPRHNKHDVRKTEFAQKLGRLMADKGWNQSELARAAQQFLPKGEEFRRDSVSTYLNKTAIPRPRALNALAKALGVTPDDLLPNGDFTAKMPYSMRPVLEEAGMCWLQVDMKVPMRAALAVLSLLEDRK